MKFLSWIVCGMLLQTLGASLLGNILTGKRVKQQEEDIII